MSRLIIASNRVANLDTAVQSGGLAVALGDALKQAGGVWFGWDGTVVENDQPLHVTTKRHENTHLATIPLTKSEYEEYYLGFANKVLWPALHYRLDLVSFEPTFLDSYCQVNQRFARALATIVQSDDLIWVHDYHMVPLAAELRACGIRNRIGFFLHIPFPPPDIFVAVPEHQWLARSLFSYDLICFQTSVDRANFVRYIVEQFGGQELGDNSVRGFGRTVRIDAVPIGIDAQAFYELAHTDEADLHITRLQRRSMVHKLIMGVDRLDYTKGLPDRMKAFRRLLELQPGLRKAVTLMQISPPTREEVAAYSDIREELEGLSGAINGEFGDIDWTPVRYIHRAVPRSTLAALFRGSQVGLVTPLRDGMNLVAKEYIAAQDPHDPGVLVLSKFAGAAEDLVEAVLVNPYDVDEMASALQQALTMHKEERQERYEALMRRTKRHDAKFWREAFVSALQTPLPKAAA